MADDFNPYHVWLAIPPDEQPANHYRLLGVRLFETGGDVIENAADRQMAHLRTIQVGKHVDLSQRLLNEVAAARICLLDPKKRAAYDQQLRAKLAATTAPEPASNATPQTAGGSLIQHQPPRPPTDAAPVTSVPTAAALPQPADQWDDLLGNPNVKQPTGAGGKSEAAKRGANNRNISIGVGAGVVLIAAVAFGIYALNSPSDGTLVFDWPANYRTDTTVSVDGVALAVPASAPWEYRYPAGSHRIVAEHLAYKLDTHVDVVAGGQQSVPADWRPKAVLVLKWPLGLRNGAELKIDGRTQTISRHDPMEVPVEPGRRMIQITRPGFNPIRTTATVAADGREMVSIAAPPTTAKLVFDWPAEERKDAKFIVDGRSQTVAAESDSAPIELTVAPGRHVVHITRTGFEPFNQAIDLSAGTDSTIRPTWTPEKKSAPTVADTQVLVEAPMQPAKKLPVPAASEQEKIAKQLNDLYKTSQTGPKDPAKAQELYDVAAKAGSSPAERYMLLMKGAEIAAVAGDLNLSLQGIDTLDADYDIDTLEAKQKLLDRFIAAGKPDQVAVAIPTAEQLVDQAVAADRYDIAAVLATSASKAVAKSKIATHKEDEDRLSRRRHDIHLIEPIYALAKKAQETLEKTPAGPEANLTVGRWLCFYKGDWTTGLPLLAKGSDEKLKALAEQEIKSPTDADQQVQLADAWWDLAQKEAGTARDSLHLHAGNIYQAVMPNLGSALKKTAIEKRLTEIANLKPIVAAIAAGSSTDVSQPTDSVKFPLNQWVDVLRLVDTTKNAVQGTWNRSGSEINCNAQNLTRLEIPVVVDGNYEMEVEFTRTAGDGDVNTIFVVGSHQCMAQLSADKGGSSGLDSVDGRNCQNHDNPTHIEPGAIQNNHRHRLSIKAIIARSGRASLDVALDGKQYLPHWEGDPAALSVEPHWQVPNARGLGLALNNDRVTFHAVRLKMVSGHASAVASVAESAPSQLAQALPVSEKPIGPVKFPLNKWVDVLRLIDTARDQVAGTWTRSETELAVATTGDARICLPVIVDGGYDLGIEFTRTAGTSDIVAMLPIGSHVCAATLSAWRGEVSALVKVDDHEAKDAENPTSTRPGSLENGHRYRLLISVRVLADNRGSIDVSLDGKHYLPNWTGNLNALSAIRVWSLPTTKRLGLGAQDNEVIFHSIRLRMVSGSASLDPAVAESAQPELAPAKAAPGKSTGGTALPLGKWADILKLVDTTQDAVKGKWARDGMEISCEHAWQARIEVPVVIDGGYDLEVEFTRTDGIDDVDTIIPVGSQQCNVVMSGWNGKASGLALIDGRQPEHDDNPTSLHPGTLENGHHYKVLISVRLPQQDRASVDVALDGKRYLPHWEGNPSSLSLNGDWAMPHPNRPGLATFEANVIYHAMRLKMVSGHASVPAR